MLGQKQKEALYKRSIIWGMDPAEFSDTTHPVLEHGKHMLGPMCPCVIKFQRAPRLPGTCTFRRITTISSIGGVRYTQWRRDMRCH
ncbi:hypothetical protein D9M71_368010 [compost metagenome]